MKKLDSSVMVPMQKALSTATLALLMVIGAAPSAFAQPAWQTEWEQVKAKAKQEGKVVVNLPPSPEHRKQLEAVFRQKFGIEVESVLETGSKAVRRLADEYKAGVHYFDVAILTFDRISTDLLPVGAVQPLDPYWILPEVKEPKNWWGGHIWTDNAKRYAYAPAAYFQDNVWYNSELVKPEEVRSWDDFLNPKWKGKIGFFDPRLGGAGQGIWGFAWAKKGEEYLKKLVQQKLVFGDRRPLADSLAKGKLAITIGPTYYSFLQFVKAGLPVKPLPSLKEGTYVSVGNGGPVIFNKHPHPNAAKVFVNWLLSKEGQEISDKTMGQASRRLDVDTRWMTEIGIRGAKDFITVEQFYEDANQTEDKILKVRRPSLEFARKLLD
ncbi:MAG: extracellular solute-binding protein [Deltaproteobacteria bacterium]|nr:extracellular solute-binding protein [Deltaproteobacteria bacterium]